MKPDWESAPEWANYLTFDETNNYVWWEKLPLYSFKNCKWYCPEGNSRIALLAFIEERPE